MVNKYPVAAIKQSAVMIANHSIPGVISANPPNATTDATNPIPAAIALVQT